MHTIRINDQTGRVVPGSVVYDPDTHTVTFTVVDPAFPDWLFENPTKEDAWS